MDRIHYIIRDKFCKKAYFTLLLVFLFIVSSSFVYLTEADSSNQSNHTYICDGNLAFAWHGFDVNGGFNSSESSFSDDDYGSIRVDDDNSVYDLTFDDSMYAYHRFDFYIIEDIEDITQIDITWKGYGGSHDTMADYYEYGHSLWIMEEGGYVLKESGTDDSKETFSVSYTSDINKIISNDGHIYLGVQSDNPADEGQSKPFPIEASVTSFIYSYYIEVNVTYSTQSSDDSSVLDVSNLGSVVEFEEFDVTVTSNGSVVEGAFVEFVGSNITTDEFGVASFVAPGVEVDSSFDILVSKPGFVGNTSSILVLDNGSSLPVLDVVAPGSVLEGEFFDVTVSSGGSALSGVSVVFDGDTFVTDSSGIVGFAAPLVLSDSYFDITASKEGYVDGSAQVLVLNNESSPADPELVVSCPVSVFEEESFDVAVTSEGSPVSGVSVVFDDTILETDSSGIVGFVAPLVDSRADYSVVASKDGFVSDSVSISVFDSSSTDVVLSYPVGGETLSGVVDVLWGVVNPPAVNIGDPSSSASFSLWYKPSVGSWSKIVSGLGVSTNNYNWDTASLDDGEYILRVVLEVDGVLYEDVSGSFTINNSEDVKTGWVYGKVSENNENFTSLENALVCALLSEKNYKCRYTDENGNYNITLNVGTYQINADKTGYNSNYTTITVYENMAALQNFILEEETDESLDDTKFLFNYAISDSSKKDSAGAKLDVDSNEIVYFSDEIDIYELKTQENTFSFKVSASNNTPSKIVFIEIEDDLFADATDSNNFVVKFDDGKILRKSLSYVLNSNHSDATYAVLSSYDQNGEQTFYFAVYIPHFSEHTIEISSLIEKIGGINNLIYYLSASVIFVLLLVIPIYVIEKKK